MVAAAVIGGGVTAGTIGATAAGVGAVATVAGTAMNAGASQNAASTQANADLQASQAANNTQLQMFYQEQANLQPFIQAGESTLGRLTAGTAAGGEFASMPSQSDINQFMDPAFNFDIQQGSLAMQNSAAANGTLLSGGTLAALQNYGQGMASNEYANAYNRFMTTRQANYGNLAQLAGIGTGTNQTGAALTGATSTSVGGNTLAGISSAGAANAAGIVGSANAWNSGLSGISGLASQYGTLSALSGGGTPSPDYAAAALNGTEGSNLPGQPF